MSNFIIFIFETNLIDILISILKDKYLLIKKYLIVKLIFIRYKRNDIIMMFIFVIDKYVWITFKFQYFVSTQF